MSHINDLLDNDELDAYSQRFVYAASEPPEFPGNKYRLDLWDDDTFQEVCYVFVEAIQELFTSVETKVLWRIKYQFTPHGIETNDVVSYHDYSIYDFPDLQSEAYRQVEEYFNNKFYPNP